MKRTTIFTAALLFAGLCAVPTFADTTEHDTFLVFTQNGIKQMPMAASAMIDDVVKGGVLIDSKSIIVMHKGKAYLVKDTKMSNGQMLMDYVEHGLR